MPPNASLASEIVPFGSTLTEKHAVTMAISSSLRFA
jgi:hypothetical protein